MTKSSALMSKEERLLWLSKHGCPDGYALVHYTEMETVKENLRIARRDQDAFKQICAKTANALGFYFKTLHKNLWEAAHHAVFDAQKEATAAGKGYDALEALVPELTSLKQAFQDMGMAAARDQVGNLLLKVDGALRFIRHQRERRPDNRTPAQIAAAMVIDGIKTIPKEELPGQ